MRPTPLDFLIRYGQSGTTIDPDQMILAFLDAMDRGLKGQASCLEMIPSYMSPDIRPQSSQNIVVADAGGTHFRTAIARFEINSQLSLSSITTTSMPGTNKTLTKTDFYQEIALRLKNLLTDHENIGFCFSYSLQMTEDFDGIITSWAKEVKAPEVVGTKIGVSTLIALQPDVGSSHQIAVLNDTVATLLGGLASVPEKTYAACIGYVFGTGTNICYIEQNSAIQKKPLICQKGQMIINTECGNFDGFPQGQFDQIVDRGSLNAGKAQAEKMTSGLYLPCIIFHALRQAISDRLFFEPSEMMIEKRLSLPVISAFLTGKRANSNRLFRLFPHPADQEIAKAIITHLIDRAAKIGAIMSAAALLKSLVGRHCAAPVAVFAEGTTFSKLPGYQSTYERYLVEFLSKRGIICEIITGTDWTLTGAAMATLFLPKNISA
jgi:hexokinase